MSTATILHLERSDGDPCALVWGHDHDQDQINAQYREDVGLGVDDHPVDEPWEEVWIVERPDEYGDPVYDWTATETDEGAKPATAWKGP